MFLISLESIVGSEAAQKIAETFKAAPPPSLKVVDLGAELARANQRIADLQTSRDALREQRTAAEAPLAETRKILIEAYGPEDPARPFERMTTAEIAARVVARRAPPAAPPPSAQGAPSLLHAFIRWIDHYGAGYVHGEGWDDFAAETSNKEQGLRRMVHQWRAAGYPGLRDHSAAETSGTLARSMRDWKAEAEGVMRVAWVEVLGGLRLTSAAFDIYAEVDRDARGWHWRIREKADHLYLYAGDGAESKEAAVIAASRRLVALAEDRPDLFDDETK